MPIVCFSLPIDLYSVGYHSKVFFYWPDCANGPSIRIIVLNLAYRLNVHKTGAFTGWAPGQLYQKWTLLILPNMTLCTHMVMSEVSTLELQESRLFKFTVQKSCMYYFSLCNMRL